MARLILVRHGETHWNVQGRFQGQSDQPLNEIGRRQAVALTRRLAHEKIHAVYASDLQRAWETAAAIAAPRGLVVHPEPRLRELGFGAWEGLTYDEIGQRYPEAVAAWQSDPMNTPPHHGESLAQLTIRVQGALEDIAGTHPKETALLVAHGGSLQVLLCIAFELAPERRWQFRLDAASVSELHIYPEGPILTLLNDVCQLRDGHE